MVFPSAGIHSGVVEGVRRIRSGGSATYSLCFTNNRQISSRTRSSVHVLVINHTPKKEKILTQPYAKLARLRGMYKFNDLMHQADTLFVFTAMSGHSV